MKRSILISLVLGVSLIFSGCSKDYVEPDESKNDQETAYLKSTKVKTAFEGVCTPVSPSPVNTWYDVTDDARVTGTSIWITEEITQIDEITFELQGTAELTLEDGLGKWEMSWYGTQTLTSPDGSTFKVVAHAVGTGIEGDVLGMKARWKYSLDFDGTPETLFYKIKGKITEYL